MTHRPWIPRLLALGAVVLLLGGAQAASAATPGGKRSAQAPVIAAAVRDAMAKDHLRAVIVKVTRGNKVLFRRAFGTSMNNVPATADMNFRNGAVAFAYLGTLLMRFVDEGVVRLDDTVDRWMPTLPEADKVTLKMLANQTTGYSDFETDPAWNAAWNADPFHVFTFRERLDYAFSRPQQFAPGTNWSYAHTNFMILGNILAKIGGKPLATLLRQKVLGPMGLDHTVATTTSKIPAPVLHSFSSERRVLLGIPPSTFFYEEATFWNGQWGTPIGANQTTTIDDMITTAVKVGTGALLSRKSYRAMTGPNLLGFGQALPVCEPSCFTQIPIYNYGLGVVRSGSWILQDPLYQGYSATEAYLPSEKVAIAAVVTYQPSAFDSQGNYPAPNSSDALFQSIGAIVAPQDPPPTEPRPEPARPRHAGRR
ncbi:MAG: serine hydrolase domain-containing protein [Thermoleophilia bacterium]